MKDKTMKGLLFIFVSICGLLFLSTGCTGNESTSSTVNSFMRTCKHGSAQVVKVEAKPDGTTELTLRCISKNNAKQVE